MNSLITIVAITRSPAGARRDRPASLVVSAAVVDGNTGEADWWHGSRHGQITAVDIEQQVRRWQVRRLGGDILLHSPRSLAAAVQVLTDGERLSALSTELFGAILEPSPVRV
jgi:hypothetical protein